MLDKIGIIGVGFVGSAIRDSFINAPVDLVLLDTNPTVATGTYDDLKNASAVFICVPSPQSDDGACDTSIMESVLEKLIDFNGVIVSKVTAPPKIYEKLAEKYKNLVYVPEFLTARNASNDYALGAFAVIGGQVLAYRNEAERIVRKSQLSLKKVVHCGIGEASLVKYSINTFLATKVIYMNELALLAETHGYEWYDIARMINLDDRIGVSHMMVPGPDGTFGFGGMCFPKDTAALKKVSNDLNIDMSLLTAAIESNNRIRSK